MRRRSTTLLCAAILLWWATAARADPLGGLNNLDWGKVALVVLAVLLVGAVAVEAIVILVEALAYRFAARLDWGRAFGSSLVANVASLLVGTPLAIVFGSQLGTAGVACAGLLLCLAIEVPIVMAMNRSVSTLAADVAGGSAIAGVAGAPTRRRLLITAVVVNVATYLMVTLPPFLLFSHRG